MKMSVPLQNASRKLIVLLSIIVCYAPFGWVLFAAENRWIWIKLWALLPGLVLIEFFHGFLGIRFDPPDWVWWSSFFLVSAGLVAAVAGLMIRLPRWRILVVAFAFALSSFLSWAAYGLYRA